MKNTLLKKRTAIFCVLLSVVSCQLSVSFGAYPPVRIKDIAHVLEARDNQLVGFGLVVGLKHTGDSLQTGFTKQALTSLLSRMGLAPQESDFKSRNVAAVIVTANIPPFLKPGQKIDVVVSSVGDASSLKGGVLLQTPLMGADGAVYAVAQGPLSANEKSSNINVAAEVNSAGAFISSGALVEKEIPVTFDEKKITVVLDTPDFTTAARLADSIRQIEYDAKAIDASTVVVPMFKGEDPVLVIAKIEMLPVVPDVVARVIINEKTGIVVIGEKVRMAPIAIAYKGFSIKEIKGSASVSDLVKALNALGASPADLITILQAIKAAGALPAEIEIIS